MKAASFIKIAFFINKSKRDFGVEVCCATTCGQKGGTEGTKGGDGASRQTIDDRRGRDLRFEV